MTSSKDLFVHVPLYVDTLDLWHTISDSLTLYNDFWRCLHTSTFRYMQIAHGVTDCQSTDD